MNLWISLRKGESSEVHSREDGGPRLLSVVTEILA